MLYKSKRVKRNCNRACGQGVAEVSASKCLITQWAQPQPIAHPHLSSDYILHAPRRPQGPVSSFITLFLAVFLTTDIWQTVSHLARHTQASASPQVGLWRRSTHGLATPSGGPYDTVVIGGGASASCIKSSNYERFCRCRTWWICGCH